MYYFLVEEKPGRQPKTYIGYTISDIEKSFNVKVLSVIGKVVD